MKLQIITPVRKVLETEVLSVTAPSALGEITVLAGHEPLLTVLEEGIVTYKTKAEVDQLAIGGGYLQTDGSVIRVLVSRAYGQDEIDEKLTAQAIEKAQDLLSHAQTVQDKKEAQQILRRSLIDSKLLKRRKKPGTSRA